MKILIVQIVISIFFVWGCSSIHVIHTEFDGSHADTYSTFQIAEPDFSNLTTLVPHKENISLIRQSVESELLNLGFKKASNADLYINIGIKMQEVQDTKETTLRDAPTFIGGKDYNWATRKIVVDEYEEGTVAIDVVNTKTKLLIWEGIATGTISKGKNKMAHRINQAIQKVFSQFPFEATE